MLLPYPLEAERKLYANFNNTSVLRTILSFIVRRFLGHFIKKLHLCRLETIECQICDILRDLVPFVQFKKRERYP